MTRDDILDMVKLNLQIAGNAFDEYIEDLIIPAAEAEIAREGITLDFENSIGDANLLVMYAGYLYRRRADSDAGMPRMLRYALNNRLFAQKMAEEG